MQSPSLLVVLLYSFIELVKKWKWKVFIAKDTRLSVRFSHIYKVYLKVKRDYKQPAGQGSALPLFILPTCTQTHTRSLFTHRGTHKPPVSSLTLKGDGSTRFRYLSFAFHPNLFSAPNMQSMSLWILILHNTSLVGKTRTRRRTSLKREGSSAADCESFSCTYAKGQAS